MVVNEGFRVFTYNTMTGKIWATVPVLNPSWGIAVSAPDNISCSIPIKAEELIGLDMASGTAENRMSLGVSYGDQVLAAGPIIDKSNDSDPDLLDVSAEGLRGIFAVRKLLTKAAQALGAANVPASILRVPATGGTTLTGLVRELMLVGVLNPPANGELPIVFPPAQSGPISRIYNGYDLKWVGDVLDELAAEENGPEFRLRPRFKLSNPTYIEHVLEVGKPLLRQDGPNWKWDGTVPETGVIGFGAKSDGRKMAARAWRPGQGQEADMLLGRKTNQDLLTQGMPWMEMDTASKQEADLNTLNSLAAQDANAAAAPQRQFSITVDAASAPELGRYLPGDWADVRIPEGHPILPNGKVTVRIMTIDGDSTNSVKIGVAPITTRQLGSAAPAAIIIGTDRRPLAPYPAEQQYPGYNLFPLDEETVV